MGWEYLGQNDGFLRGAQRAGLAGARLWPVRKERFGGRARPDLGRRRGSFPSLGAGDHGGQRPVRW